MNKLNDNLKTFSLIVIACSVFTMTVLQGLDRIDYYNSESSTPASSTVQAPKPPVPPKNPVDPNMPKTTMMVDTMFNFGTINEGDTINHIFTITNTGKNPLKIFDAFGSCGCTTPHWPKEPILPGKSADMRVHFDSNHKSGKQTKTVTLQTNAEKNPVVIHLEGNVTPEKK